MIRLCLSDASSRARQNLLAIARALRQFRAMTQSTSFSPARYSNGAMFFHWAIAALIALNFALAWVAEGLPPADRGALMGNHFAIGLTVLVLTLLRIVWKMIAPAPPLVESLEAWEAALAKVTHGLLLLITLALPLAGWIMVSAYSGGEPISYFGLFDFPGLPLTKSEPTSDLFSELHEVFAFLTLALFALHLIGAVKHMVIDRDGTMRRIVPWG